MTIKILLVDDEAIVLDSLEHILNRAFPGEFTCLRAKSGRELIELADLERPDLVMLDLQMPGIQGLQAIEDVLQRHPELLFIILSAYERFDFAQEAISLSAFAYLTKPFGQEEIIQVLQQAMAEIRRRQEVRATRLKHKDLAARYLPILTRDFIYAQILENASHQDNEQMLRALGHDLSYGRMAILTWSAADTKADEVSPEMWARFQEHVERHHGRLGHKLQLAFPGILLGALMSRSVVAFLPAEGPSEVLSVRSAQIERVRQVLLQGNELIEGICFRFSFGPIRPIEDLHDSYKQASEALRFSHNSVVHADDIPLSCDYSPDYPIELEDALFQAVNRGLPEESADLAAEFFDWMLRAHPDAYDSIRLKALEFVLFAEQRAYLSGGRTYTFESRQNYFQELFEQDSADCLKEWFVAKIAAACSAVRDQRGEKLGSLIREACDYIDRNFSEEITLDLLCGNVHLSPYYFSKLFKEQTGENFIDYLTRTRLNHAAEALRNTDRSIKEISAETGYQDANYFSRLFKRWYQCTPSEYREGSYDEA